MDNDVARALTALLESGEKGALATVIRATGSTPQRPGARLLLTGDGTIVGTVGGGAIERAVIEALQTCVATGKSDVLIRDLGRDLGMCCGGRMEVFVERVEARPRLLLFGAGHVGKATAALATSAGFDVTVIDDREELNTEARFEGCQRIVAEPSEVIDELGLTSRDFVLIVTHDHRLDEEALELCAARPHRYIGMIGSKRKVFRVIQRIHARRGAMDLARVYAPVGLDIGAITPEEIAISISAELVALRHGAEAPHMRAVDHPGLARVLAAELTPEAAEKVPVHAQAPAERSGAKGPR
jgi:xanthine dehydrogenase accessory factor